MTATVEQITQQLETIAPVLYRFMDGKLHTWAVFDRSSRIHACQYSAVTLPDESDLPTIISKAKADYAIDRRL